MDNELNCILVCRCEQRIKVLGNRCHNEFDWESTSLTRNPLSETISKCFQRQSIY